MHAIFAVIEPALKEVDADLSHVVQAYIGFGNCYLHAVAAVAAAAAAAAARPQASGGR